MSLGHLLASASPTKRSQLIAKLQSFSRRIRSRIFWPQPCSKKQNQFADAEQEYKQAAALDPSSSDAYVGIANIYMHGSRFLEAEEILRKLVSLRPNDAAHTCSWDACWRPPARMRMRLPNSKQRSKLAP